MAIEIKQISDNKLYVNNKLVYQDVRGNWIAPIELTTNEMQSFQEHIKVKAETDDKKP